jgi:hypothetical protein
VPLELRAVLRGAILHDLGPVLHVAAMAIDLIDERRVGVAEWSIDTGAGFA